MSVSGNDDDVLAAALIQIAGHAERISDLDGRETSHHESTSLRVRQLRDRAEALAVRLDDVARILGRHANALNAIDEIDKQIAAIGGQLADLASASSSANNDAYDPTPSPRWWQLRDAERSSATDRLRAWVEQVYRPGYGHLAAALPPCWEQHPLCLYTLDWVSELWSALYLCAERSASTLAAQAEWQTRLLSAAADQMAREAVACSHHNGHLRRPPPDGRLRRGT